MGGTTVDTYRTPMGIRTAAFDPNQGFSLNGNLVNGVGVPQLGLHILLSVGPSSQSLASHSPGRRSVYAVARTILAGLR